MKKIIFTIFTLTVCVFANAQGIEFEHSTFQEALAKAKAENKMVFMDCYTTWCGPCKKMSKEVFPQNEVGDYINANFVSLKMDMEKGEGIDLAKKYSVKAFPTLLFMDANGKVLHTKVGGADTAGFIAEAKIANDPSKQLVYIEKQYNEGNRDIKLVSDYIKGLYEAFKRDEAIKVGKAHIPNMSEAQYNTEEGFTILAYTGVDFRSEIYNYVLKNKSEFIDNEKIGQKSVDYLISNAINTYILNIAKNETIEAFKSAIKETKEDFVSPRQEMVENNWYNEFYIAKKQFDKWFESNIKNAEAQTDKRRQQSFVINTTYRVAMDPVFESSKDIYQKAIEETEKLKAEDSEMLAAYYCLASLYKKVNDKAKALLNVNAYIEKNAAKGGTNDKYITDFKSEIENM